MTAEEAAAYDTRRMVLQKRYEEDVVPDSEDVVLDSEDVVLNSEDDVVVPETPDEVRSERSFEFPLSGLEQGNGAPEVSFAFPLSGLKRFEDPDELKDDKLQDDKLKDDDEWKKRYEDLEKRYGKLEKRYGKLKKRYGILREAFDNMRDLARVLAKRVSEDI